MAEAVIPRRAAHKARYVADDLEMLATDINDLRGLVPTGDGDVREVLDSLAAVLSHNAKFVRLYAQRGGAS